MLKKYGFVLSLGLEVVVDDNLDNDNNYMTVEWNKVESCGI